MGHVWLSEIHSIKRVVTSTTPSTPFFNFSTPNLSCRISPPKSIKLRNQLATAMLERPLSLRFLHDLISARQRTLSRAIYVGPKSTFPTTSAPQPSMRERMIRVWYQIALNNELVSSTNVPPAGLAYTCVVSSGRVPPGADNGQHGPRTEISIHKGVIHDPASAIQRFPANDSRVRLCPFRLC